MKLSNVVAKLTSGNHKVLSVLGGLALAGAAFTAAAPAAQAQQFGIGVRIGGAHYVVPAPRPAYRVYGYGGGYYAPQPEVIAPAYGVGYWNHRGYDDGWRAHESWDHRGYNGRPAPYRAY